MESEAVPEVFVGVDVARKSVVATALDAGGGPLTQQRFGPTPEEPTEFLRAIPGRKHVALEAGSYWAPLFEAATTVSASVVLSNPLRTKFIAEASLKTNAYEPSADEMSMQGALAESRSLATWEPRNYLRCSSR